MACNEQVAINCDAIDESQGNVDITFVVGTRNLVPAKYEITATKSGETPVTETVSIKNVNLTLKLGTWDISVVGKNSSNVVLCSGYNQLEVKAGANSLTIGLVSGTGGRSLTWTGLLQDM